MGIPLFADSSLMAMLSAVPVNQQFL